MTADIITHAGREYDLTALEMPFGLLPEPVQEALRNWPHGFSTWLGMWVEVSSFRGGRVRGFLQSDVYRAVPAPVEVRLSCYRGVYADHSGQSGTCVKRADGTIDWATWEASK